MSENQDIAWLLQEKHNGEKTEGFFADCALLEAGTPLAYLIGHIPFLNSTIYLDGKPLIPRPETEFWVAKALEEARTHTSKPLRVLDLCAGSGCIGVATLSSLPHTQVDFVEIDESLHATIQKNIEMNDISMERAHIFGGHLFEQVNDRYDYILSNPPYIPEQSERVADSVRAHEPSLALYAGSDGLSLIREMIEKASAYLTPAGVLYIEHEPEQACAIKEHAQAHGFVCDTHSDQYDVQRFSVLRMAQ